MPSKESCLELWQTKWGWKRGLLVEYSIKFLMLLSICIDWKLHIEISNQKIFCWIMTTMLNLLILGCLTIINLENYCRLHVEAHAMHLLKWSQENLITELLEIFGHWVSSFMEWYVVHYHLKKKQQRNYTKRSFKDFTFCQVISA